MAKDNKAPTTSQLPSAVPAAAPAKTSPAEEPRRKRKVVRQPNTNTILSSDEDVAEGLKQAYGWDDPSLEDEATGDESAASPAKPTTGAVALPSTPVVTPTPKAPAAPEHSAVTLHLARQLGITDEETADSSPKELDRLVKRLYDQREDMRRENVIAEAKRKPVERDGTAPTAATKSVPAAEDVLSWGVDEDGTAITEDQLHPGLVNVFKAQAKQIKALEGMVKQLAGVEGRRQHQTQTQQLDSLFARNPDQFGSEPGHVLVKSDPAKFQKRLAVQTVMKALQSGSMQDRFEEAHEIIYGKLPTSAAPAAAAPPNKASSATPRDETTGKFVKGDPIHDAEVAEWEEAGTEVPTNRVGRTLPASKDKAVDGVKKMLRDNPEILPDYDYSGEFLSNGQI